MAIRKISELPAIPDLTVLTEEGKENLIPNSLVEISWLENERGGQYKSCYSTIQNFSDIVLHTTNVSENVDNLSNLISSLQLSVNALCVSVEDLCLSVNALCSNVNKNNFDIEYLSGQINDIRQNTPTLPSDMTQDEFEDILDKLKNAKIIIQEENT